MADCGYTKIAIMQLFYELKQKFPSIPDQIVSELMQQAAYNREECEKRLSAEYRNYQPQSYPSDIVRKMTEGKERPKTLSLATTASGLLSRITNPLRIREDLRGKTKMNRRQPSGDESAGAARASPKTANDVAAVVSTSGSAGVLSKRPLVNGDARLPSPDESVQNFEIRSGRPDLYVSDLRLQFQNDVCGRGQTSLRVQYERDSQSAPATPSSEPRPIDCDTGGGVCSEAASQVRKHRSVLHVDRPPKSTATSADGGRPCTGVKMTMRPPSAEPLPPIKISTDGGANMIYMTTSSGSSDGYQNQLQISINEDGNTTISASRTRNAANSLEPRAEEAAGQPANEGGACLLTAFESLSTTSELRLREQIERKKRLEAELERGRELLAQTQLEIKAMEEDLERRKKAPIVSERVIILRAEVAALSDECCRMQEVIRQTLQTPLIPVVRENNNETENWTCRMCTFKNHPTLPKCEQCEMARVDLQAVRTRVTMPQISVSPHHMQGPRTSSMYGEMQPNF